MGKNMTVNEAMLIQSQVCKENGIAEELLRKKCQWEHMTRAAVVMEWGDPRTWPEALEHERRSLWVVEAKGKGGWEPYHAEHDGAKMTWQTSLDLKAARTALRCLKRFHRGTPFRLARYRPDGETRKR